MRRLLLLLAALSVAACDSALSEGEAFSAVLSTDDDAYGPSETVALQVENTGTVPIEFGPPSCWADLQAEGTAGAWAFVARDEPACADVVVVLPPGEPAVSSIPLDVPPGTYRFLLNVSDGDEELRLSTAPFVVG